MSSCTIGHTRQDQLSESAIFLNEATTQEQSGALKEGSISKISGFLPSTPIARAMPESHSAWDQMARNMPVLIRRYQFRQAIEQMPLLDTQFSDGYLDRAAVLISALAHGYCFQQKSKLPKQLEIPWQEITKRLGRSHLMRSVSDDFLHNWIYKDPTAKEPMRIENLDTVAPYFLEPDDTRMNLTVTLTEHHFAPALQHMVNAQTAVVQQNDDLLLDSLYGISTALRNVTDAFNCTSPNQHSPFYVDPVIWAKTFAVIGASSREGELGNSGVSMPAFHAMDAFIGREHFHSTLGSQMTERAKDLPEKIHTFLQKLCKVSVREYVLQSKNIRLKNAFDQLIEMYTGETGLLTIHRRKAIGYIKLAMQAGRISTNNEHVGQEQEKSNSHALHPWFKINEDLNDGRYEKLIVRCHGRYHEVHGKSMRKISDNVYQITMHLEERVVNWNPGDKLSLIPENSMLDIEAALELLNIKDTTIDLPRHWQKWFWETAGRALQSVSIRTLLTFSDLHRLAYPKDNQISLSDFLTAMYKAHPTMDASQFCDPASELFLPNLLQPMQDRLYSVTSVDKHSDSVVLTVGGAAPATVTSVSHSTPIKCPFTGKVASTYLTSPHASSARISHVPSYDFSAPSNPQAKIVMFAAGTGIAPFIGYIQNAQKGTQLTLYYSVRTNDFPYKDELLALQAAGRLTLKIVCTDKDSSSGSGRIDALLTNNDEIASLSTVIQDKNTYLYICGSTGFHQTVQNSLNQIIKSTNLANDTLVKMAAERRYLAESYGTTENLQMPAFTLTEVAMHNQIDDCWVVIHDKVYNLSSYIDFHPGGAKILMSIAGLNGTDDFSMIHANERGIESQLASYAIGTIKKVAPLPSMEQLYRKNLAHFLHATEMLNHDFNNSTFYHRGCSFRLFSKDYLEFFVNSITSLEKHIGSIGISSKITERFSQYIELWELLIAKEDVENDAKKEIALLWKYKKQLLTDIRQIYYTLLTAIEKGQTTSSTLEEDLTKAIQLALQTYWQNLSASIESRLKAGT